VFPVKLPHEQRLDFFPLRTKPLKHGFWKRNEDLSVTHVCSEFHQNKTEIITENWNISHLIPMFSLHQTAVWLGQSCSGMCSSFLCKLLVGMTGGCRAAALFSASSCHQLEISLHPG